METLAYFLAVPVIAVALVAGHLWFWRRHYGRFRVPDERHFVKTDDGWTLALSRLRANPEGPGGGRALICCHGLACNHRFFDLDDEHSLGRHLAAQGFDVWLLDLRGAGASERASFFGRPWSFGILDHAHHDVPAAVAHVQAETGQAAPLWLGHSMGGLVALLAGADGCVDALGGVVTLGTPMHPDPVRVGFGTAARWLDRFDWWPVARLGRWCHLVVPFTGRIRLRRIERLFYSANNMSFDVLRRFMVDVVGDVPQKVINGFVDALLHRRGLDGRPIEHSLERLGKVEWPALAIAGNIDMLAPPASVRAGFDALGSEDKEYALIGGGVDGGHTGDWGHLDLVLGREAREIIYPRVTQWLLARASTRETSEASAPSAPAS